MGATMRRAIGVLVLVGGLAFPSAVGAQVTVDGCYAHLVGTGPAVVYNPDGSFDDFESSNFTDEWQAGTYRVVWVANGNLTETFTIANCPHQPALTDDPNDPPAREWVPADDAPLPGDTVEPAVHATVDRSAPTRVDPPASVYIFRLAKRP